MKKILLIEDDIVLREATADFLQEEGFKVFTAQDGMLGIKSAIKNLPDLVLCDIEMPSFNGYEVYSILQENIDTRIIPFIFLTARAENEDIRAAMQKGVDDYITKPFDYDELLQTIKVRIEKRERLTRAASETYKTLFENSLTGVFVITARRFVYVNKQFSKFLGYTHEELNEINWLSLISQEDKKHLLSKFKSLSLGINKVIHSQLKIISKKRKLLDLELSAGITNYKGKPSLIGNVIAIENKSKVDISLWIDEISKTDLDKVVEILEQNQSSLSPESVEKLKKLSQNYNSNEKPKLNINITKREFEVLELFCNGLTKHEISEKLFLSVRTVERHRAQLIEKTNTHSTVDLVLFAIKNKLIEIELD